ncbi:MAG: hypothetical protein CBB68_13960 [Rhodospirillaceae bacterium TMED8]|nr:hypothetical protein [Magnetovibrio sp.]OUT48066.1 MAG: hypothetical protein CBB68_13960 [Rhodospirillaceae bacterium TMED8]|tara:strand:+ start:3848 stop:4033 length:186 start_codon:yes stop_codon:yes gene_type:complete
MTTHDQKVIAAAQQLAACDGVLLGQFSIAPLAVKIEPTVHGTVLTSPHTTVAKFKSILLKT